MAGALKDLEDVRLVEWGDLLVTQMPINIKGI